MANIYSFPAVLQTAGFQTTQFKEFRPAGNCSRISGDGRIIGGNGSGAQDNGGATAAAGPAAGGPGNAAITPTGRASDEMIRPAGVPDVVWDAVCSVHDMPRVPGVLYHEIPVDHALCDFGIGVEMMMDLDADSPLGWVSIQYSQNSRTFRERAGLQSHRHTGTYTSTSLQSDAHWRCVAFMRFPISGSEDDGLTPAMYWDEIGARMAGVAVGAPSGTVSVTRNTVFQTGTSPICARSGLGCEVRMSWTPATLDNGRIDSGMQVFCLADILRSMADGEGDAVVG